MRVVPPFRPRPFRAEADANRQHDRFAARVVPHLDAAWRYARALSRDPVLAEDLVQEAFLRAFRAFDTCRGDERAWLFAILRNAWHDTQRARRPLAALDDVAEPVDPTDLEALAGTAREAARLRALVDALPEPFREVIVLRELEELSYKDIARITAAPIGTVMSRLARGRAMLAALVLGQDPERAAG